MTQASLIIGYHNEAGLVQLLLESIIPAVRERIEVILVDDGSTETYDYTYDGEIRRFKVEVRGGIGAAFDFGVRQSRSHNIILCGGDIVFKGGNWLDYFLEDLTEDNRALYCTTCLNLHEHAVDVNAPGLVLGYGAYIIPIVGPDDIPNSPEDFASVFQTRWLPVKLKDEAVYEIPCILGAVYAVDKEWYQFVRGFNGHRYWGCLEPYISMKNWMLGGRNMVDTRVETGHWFIEKKNRFPIESSHIAYNKLLTILVLGGELVQQLFDALNHVEGVNKAVELVQNKTKEEIEELRAYVNDRQVKSLSNFIEWQSSLISKLGKLQ